MGLIGHYSFQMQPQDGDFTEHIFASSLGDYILQAAAKNADDNGFGVRELNRENYTWVLIRMAVEIIRMPTMYERISIKTWIESIRAATTTRNFAVYDEQNQIIAYSGTNWAMIDLTNRKPIDLGKLPTLTHYISGNPIPISIVSKLPSVTSPLFTTRNVQYSDIDFNKHVNSMKYLQWILNEYSIDWYSHHAIKRFDINFLHEATYGDQINIHLQRNGLLDLYEMKRQDDSLCKIQIQWENN